VLDQTTGHFEEKIWRDIKVGMIVKVLGNEFFPQISYF
jgi:hypothetical protein